MIEPILVVLNGLILQPIYPGFLFIWSEPFLVQEIDIFGFTARIPGKWSFSGHMRFTLYL